MNGPAGRVSRVNRGRVVATRTGQWQTQRAPRVARVASRTSGSAGKLKPVTLIAVSAFGPYLIGGIRTDQLVVYGLLVALLPFLFARIGSASPAVTAILVAWSLIVAVASLGWVSPPQSTTRYGTGSAVANLDNLLMPLAVVILTLMVVKAHQREDALRRVAEITVAAMCVNAVVSVVQMARPLEPLLARWWSSDGVSGLTTAERALTLGRYTGIIGQPVVAGLFYSIALVCALYVLRQRPLRLAFVVTLLIVGGVLTVSKAFLLLGLPVAGWQLIRTRGSRGARFAAFTVIGGVAAYMAAVFGMLDRWQGLALLMQLTPGAERAHVAVYLGNRFGVGSSTEPIIDTVLASEPLLGFGMPGLAIYTDTAWVQTLVLAGLVGAAAFTVILVALVVGYLHRRRGLPDAERRLFAGLVVIAVAGSFATPALTVNRLSVVMWILLTLLLFSRNPRETEVGAGAQDGVRDFSSTLSPLKGQSPGSRANREITDGVGDRVRPGTADRLR